MSRSFLPAVVLCGVSVAFAQQSPSPAAVAAGQEATPAIAAPSTAAAAASRIGLDVLVTGKDGKPVGELEPSDFMLLDNGQPRKILGFRRTDGVAGNRFDPPVEVIILLDAVDMSYQALTVQRLMIEKYLRRNDGHLTHPASFFIYGTSGLQVQPAPSLDGNALAEALDKAKGLVSAQSQSGNTFEQVERVQRALDTVSGIAENEVRKQGRKMLIWIGPGWPLLVDSRIVQSNESRRAYYQMIISISKKLREARITMYGIYPVVGVISRGLYEAYLKPVTDPHKTEAAHAAMQVMAIHSGGAVIEAGNRLDDQIADCAADIGSYYTLTFAPPPSAAFNEYHDLKVVMAQPGLAARTTSGYYNQP